MKTILYGDLQVPVIERPWKTTANRLPYRKTYTLKPGQHWTAAQVVAKQWEYYVLLEEGVDPTSNQHQPIRNTEDQRLGVEFIPAGAVIARELIQNGASWATWIELWGGVVLMGPDLICLENKGPARELLDQLQGAGHPFLGGLPDVLAGFSDGRIGMREAKHISAKYQDRLGPKQHKLASTAQKLFGDKLDLAVVEWGTHETVSI